MSGRRRCVVLSAVATALLASAGVADANPVVVQSISWQFYQGGLVRQDNTKFEIHQDHYNNLFSNQVTRNFGGAEFNSIASITHSTQVLSSSVVFTSTATLHAAAAVPAHLTQGHADAFATLSRYNVVLEVLDGPHLYVGTEDLIGPDGIIPSGEIVMPGIYEVMYDNLFGIDAVAVAEPGQVASDEATIHFRLEFIPVPAPAAAAMGVPAVGLLALRRRRA